MPYVRTTARAKWVSRPYLRYKKFSDIVRIAFCIVNGLPYDKQWPIQGRCLFTLDMLVGFKSARRGDVDNIVKGVLDSLLKDDNGCLRQSTTVIFNGEARLDLELTVFNAPERSLKEPKRKRKK